MKDIFPFLCILWTAMTSSGMGTNAPPFMCYASKNHKHCWRFAHTPVTYPAHPFLLANKISILFHRECAQLQEMNQISLNSSCTLSFAVPVMGGRPSAGLWNVKRSEEEAWGTGEGVGFSSPKRGRPEETATLFSFLLWGLVNSRALGIAFFQDLKTDLVKDYIWSCGKEVQKDGQRQTTNWCWSNPASACPRLLVLCKNQMPSPFKAFVTCSSKPPDTCDFPELTVCSRAFITNTLYPDLPATIPQLTLGCQGMVPL